MVLGETHVHSHCKTATTSDITANYQWWRRLVNAYEVTTGTVCLQRKNCVIHTHSELCSVSTMDANAVSTISGECLRGKGRYGVFAV